ncbi:hypothetical protein M5W83_01525 [Paenibacillus thiaminolyticus]|uniref:Topology modulation protein n=1 Tax=Paenibacillus thiaminolyticus TaxID=49283 RepID=A0ABT4FNW4_PANTH|nr:hypothetical protein [Paenibacillus thiaminolyticus]MCY9538475.1 hypothetical protein [Paenibacillus thiaminolyticus]MCY9601212.1 hypothetical protein [Paenibacillus thiaminolyticus]MCY9605860.1 hypothetical protein [Paenibacillus thiaminolyticus]MCY9611261.1 hypothetical protein [Paenibacillus thiaminolyticus]MCY9617490.1 hypothetical protein [Paenibacillus thiaminolyticus]
MKWVNFNIITTYRVLKRRIQYHGQTRPDLNEGCPESIDWEFIKYGWNFRRDKRPGIMAKLESYSPTTKIIIIRKPKEASLMLEEIRRLGLSYFEESEAWGP